MPTLVVDLIVDDPVNDEFVLCLVETGPWIEPMNARLKKLQDRLYDSFDAIADGYVSEKYPQSRGRKIRLQVDSHDAPPESVLELVRNFSRHLQNDAEYREAIHSSPFVEFLRVVNGVDMGRRL
jgi:hypothetical protein